MKKKLPSKVAHNRPRFLYCQPAKNQLKSQFLFIKNISPRDLYKMTSPWNLTMHIMILSLCTAWNFWLDNFHIWFWIGITSVSKKSGQMTVVIQYYSLSIFLWNGRYKTYKWNSRFMFRFSEKATKIWLNLPFSHREEIRCLVSTFMYLHSNF